MEICLRRDRIKTSFDPRQAIASIKIGGFERCNASFHAPIIASATTCVNLGLQYGMVGRLRAHREFDYAVSHGAPHRQTFPDSRIPGSEIR
ncbi:hypothetical protein Bmul_1841 [Burkholderia multivorans ATCC 17616]|nr:hypothetical protein Bmul_1841 [Burkholderia multivorans ATCC 17616]